MFTIIDLEQLQTYVYIYNSFKEKQHSKYFTVIVA